jgi:hypothetical protein
LVIFTDDDELQRYGERFLLRLYRMADGIIGKPFDRYDVFKSTGLKGLLTATPEEGIRQVTDEIVQHLWLQGFITTSENSKEISLNLAGLTEAERLDKRSSPVTRPP